MPLVGTCAWKAAAMRLAPAIATLIGGLLLTLASFTADACEEGHWIENVSNDGAVIILDDRSAWLVDFADRIDTVFWLPVSDIVACDDMLINTDHGEKVTARRIH
jgi:hypothetical protein